MLKLLRIIITVALLTLQLRMISGQDISKSSYTLYQAVSVVQSDLHTPMSDEERKDRITQLKSEWYQWLMAINKVKVLQEYYDYLNDVNRVSEILYQNGEIDLSSKSSLQLMVAELETKFAIAVNEKEICQNNVRKFLFTENQVIPLDTSLSMYEIDKTNQYAADIRDTSAYSQFKHKIDIENMELELDNLFIDLQFFSSYKIPDAEIALHTASAQFKAEEIDYITFLNAVHKAFNTKLEYLELLNRYNQHAIRLEHEAY